MGFTGLDIVSLVLIAILMLRCALRGFLKEFMTWASLALGILAAILLYKPGGNFIREQFSWDAQILPEIAAFLLLFLIVFFFIRFLELILRDIIERIHLGGPDHFFGLLFGLLEGLILVSFLLLVLYIQPLFDAGPLLEASILARVLLPIAGKIHQNIANGSGV
jgi:membrane protein required for colicin V production